VVEAGSFDELVGKGGLFAALAKAQFLAGAAAAEGRLVET
jgi:ATP-binding cassette subfamily B protein